MINGNDNNANGQRPPNNCKTDCRARAGLWLNVILHCTTALHFPMKNILLIIKTCNDLLRICMLKTTTNIFIILIH